MNYALHYQRLVERARGRKLTEYSERHHILPRCMGGDNSRSNVVRLLPEEHYVAHQLLVKIYPHKKGLALAAHYMAKQCTGRRGYGWLRRRMATDRQGQALSPAAYEKMVAHRRSPESRALSALKQTGKKYSAESRLKMSIAKRGKKRSAEAIAKGVAANKGRIVSAETGRKISMAKMGKKLSPEHKAAMMGRKYSAESRLKMALAHLGKKLTQEQKEKIGAAFRGKKLSMEHRAKLSAAAKRRNKIAIFAP